MAKRTEEQQLMLRIERRLMKGIVDYGLIEDGDHLLVGLSGGKDSLALTELLARRARIYRPRFTLTAVHVAMRNIPYSIDADYLRSFCEKRGVPFILREAEFDASTDTRKSPCFLCSWNRRKELFTVAHELGCNKIALGHHMDDILVTLLMNQTFQGAFSTMPPRLVMKKFDMTIIRPLCLVHEADLEALAAATIIRPLCLVHEADLEALAAAHAYRRQVKSCPYEHDSHRSAMRDILRRLEAMNPEARYSLWASMTNVQEELLPPKI